MGLVHTQEYQVGSPWLHNHSAEVYTYNMLLPLGFERHVLAVFDPNGLLTVTHA